MVYSLSRQVGIWLMIALAGVLVQCTDSKKNKRKPLDQIKDKHALIDKLSKEIEQNPNDPTLYFRRGRALEAVRKTDLAIRDIKKAAALDSANVKYLKKLGKLYVDNNALKKALGVYKRAHKIAPEETDIQLSIAKIHHYLKNYQKVINRVNNVLKQEVHNAKAYFLKGVVYKETGDTTRALSNFQTAVEQDPNYFDAYMQLGLLNNQLNKPIAVEYFNNAIEVDSSKPTPYYAKAMYYQDRNKFKKAKALYQKIIKLDSDYENAFYNLGHLYFLEDSLKKAYRHFDMAIEVSPYFTKAFYMRGLCAEKMGRAKEAKQDYKQALKLNENFELASKGLDRLNQ